MTEWVRAEHAGDEREALLGWLAQQRDAIRRTLHGLTAEQATSKPTASELSLAGLVKHVAEAEATWLRYAQGLGPAVQRDPEDFSGRHRLEEGETIPLVLERYAGVAAETERLVREVPSLDEEFDFPDFPWFPEGKRSWRWMLLQVVTEVARHAGHADLIRETLDDRKAWELLGDELQQQQQQQQ